ncbi:MAG: hypothetical protein LBM04_09810 [Opitutaceae bacterium]|nr:hypothetical protein [Opitutaceae bacterium]
MLKIQYIFKNRRYFATRDTPGSHWENPRLFSAPIMVFFCRILHAHARKFLSGNTQGTHSVHILLARLHLFSHQLVGN